MRTMSFDLIKEVIKPVAWRIADSCDSILSQFKQNLRQNAFAGQHARNRYLQSVKVSASSCVSVRFWKIQPNGFRPKPLHLRLLPKSKSEALPPSSILDASLWNAPRFLFL